MLATIAVTFFTFTDGAMSQTAIPISVSLTNYAFTPSVLNLKAGITYRMHFTNDGSKEHNFNAPEFFAASQVTPADRGKVEEGSVELDSGQAIDLTVTPSRAGSYSFDCSHFMHSMLGMHGKIAVQ
jgi:plastocyanin